jgi:hypothetical protein
MSLNYRLMDVFWGVSSIVLFFLRLAFCGKKRGLIIKVFKGQIVQILAKR